MTNALSKFQRVVRRTRRFAAPDGQTSKTHPFDERNMHPTVDEKSRKLFDDGHYSQATLEAYKCIESEVKKISKINKPGYELMMRAFNERNSLINMSSSLDISEESKKNEQIGYKHIFAGAMSAIRNPRGHEPGFLETQNECLDYLSLASLLLRRLDKQKHRIKP